MNRNNGQWDIHPLKLASFSTLGFLTAMDASAFASALGNAQMAPAAFHAGLSTLWLGISHGVMNDKSEEAIGLKGHFMGFALGAAMSIALPEPYAEEPVSDNQPKTSIEMIEPGL